VHKDEREQNASSINKLCSALVRQSDGGQTNSLHTLQWRAGDLNFEKEKAGSDTCRLDNYTDMTHSSSIIIYYRCTRSDFRCSHKPDINASFSILQHCPS
jgi:hypothetical protein